MKCRAQSLLATQTPRHSTWPWVISIPLNRQTTATSGISYFPPTWKLASFRGNTHLMTKRTGIYPAGGVWYCQYSAGTRYGISQQRRYLFHCSVAFFQQHNVALPSDSYVMACRSVGGCQAFSKWVICLSQVLNSIEQTGVTYSSSTVAIQMTEDYNIPAYITEVPECENCWQNFYDNDKPEMFPVLDGMAGRMNILEIFTGLMFSIMKTGENLIILWPRLMGSQSATEKLCYLMWPGLAFLHTPITITVVEPTGNLRSGMVKRYKIPIQCSSLHWYQQCITYCPSSD